MINKILFLTIILGIYQIKIAVAQNSLDVLYLQNDNEKISFIENRKIFIDNNLSNYKTKKVVIDKKLFNIYSIENEVVLINGFDSLFTTSYYFSRNNLIVCQTNLTRDNIKVPLDIIYFDNGDIILWRVINKITAPNKTTNENFELKKIAKSILIQAEQVVNKNN